MELCILMTLKQKNQKLMSVCNSIRQRWDRMCHEHWCDRLQECMSTHCPEMWCTNWEQWLGSDTIPITDVTGELKVKGTPTNAQPKPADISSPSLWHRIAVPFWVIPQEFPQKPTRQYEERGWEAFSTPTSQQRAEKVQGSTSRK